MSTQPMEAGDLELGLLRTFLAVVDCGTLRKTAAAIDKTQPAVSHQMLRLEKIVGHKLFARGRNGITLTHHGELLMAYANRAVDLNDEILVRLRGERPGGRVAIGMSIGANLFNVFLVQHDVVGAGGQVEDTFPGQRHAMKQAQYETLGMCRCCWLAGWFPRRGLWWEVFDQHGNVVESPAKLLWQRVQYLSHHSGRTAAVP